MKADSEMMNGEMMQGDMPEDADRGMMQKGDKAMHHMDGAEKMMPEKKPGASG